MNVLKGLSAPLGTKQAEYIRSIELFEEIFKDKGVYFALAFLYDSQYTNADLKNMMDIIEPNVRKMLITNKK